MEGRKIDRELEPSLLVLLDYATGSRYFNGCADWLVIQRYRVLFIVEKQNVTILHVRGSYPGEIEVSEASE
jgi:hypothetical protein